MIDDHIIRIGRRPDTYLGHALLYMVVHDNDRVDWIWVPSGQCVLDRILDCTG